MSVNPFDELPDESEPSVGTEVGEALAGAVSEIGKANDRMAEKIGQAITEALRSVDSKQIVIAEKIAAKQWRFKVLRDKKGDLDEVIAIMEALK